MVRFADLWRESCLVELLQSILSAEERCALERLKRSASTPQALARRARMISMAGDGLVSYHFSLDENGED